MARSHITVLACTGAFILMSLAPQARASDVFTVDIIQSGSDVVAMGTGSVSVSGSTDDGPINDGVGANASYLTVGSGEATIYDGVSGPANFGSGNYAVPSSETGGVIGFGFDQYAVPFGYVAGDLLTNSSTWDSATLSSLGLTDGTYTFTLSSGDSIVLNIGAPEPTTSSLLLAGIGLLGLMLGFRKHIRVDRMVR
jgi:PEP-CTERM motif